MTALRRGGVAVAAAILLAACSGPDDGAGPSTVPPVPPSTTSSSTASTSTAPPTAEPSTPTPFGTLEQPAVWPAADDLVNSPGTAAASFVETTLGVPARLGDFRSGDSRSGEIDLLFAGNPDTTPVVRSTLLLRMLGAGDGWFVTAAVNEHVRIDAPTPGATVAAGPLEVSGAGRGFEGLVIVEAFRPGTAEPLDRQTAQGGSLEQAEPFTATLDLSGATPGETLAIVVHGGTGHEEDPGDLAAIPVVVRE
ncbi:Gmad2 immunoglobulin-like domain-containing protein [Isoptericola sp. b441]|uniref:Gmad2 immunoglobulin-like domain-containing protein n=1 Tax=Actinotalea lenta TaxID=3064654 RepID=A0ABT9D6V1_9CELL|nr:Gmad2 immunoglobulin-like domain-containing protein [Isoptericola sp. b441]MDO8106575.1 Gmad2 immunoglobulin-like domain-containing protein [Isoptericola sp. b441]